MNYEQKYKEALKRAKEWYFAPNSDKIPTYANRVIEEIFPELKESEDERMLNLLKKYVHYNISDMALEADHITREHLVSWLEKQCKNDTQVILPQFTFDDILALQCCMETVKKVQEDKDLYEKLKDLHGKVYDAYQLENLV